jgi:hypothetical protein
MLITKAVVNRLSPALREAQPQPGDGSMIVRSQFSFVGLPPEPTFRQVAGASIDQSSSFAIQKNAQVANAVSNTSTIARLLSGYWRLRIQGTYRSNYVLATAQPGDFRILLADLVSNFQITAKFAQLSGTQEILFVEEFVVPSFFDVTAILDTNGVGQEHTYSLSVWGQRLL